MRVVDHDFFVLVSIWKSHYSIGSYADANVSSSRFGLLYFITCNSVDWYNLTIDECTVSISYCVSYYKLILNKFSIKSMRVNIQLRLYL